MTPPKERRGTARPAEAPQLQPRPAERAQPKDPAPEQEFPPNPVAAVRAGREQPTDRMYQVVGPKAVGGVLYPGVVVLRLTDAQAEALEAGGHVMAVTEDDLEPADDPSPSEGHTPDQPVTGTDKEGN